MSKSFIFVLFDTGESDFLQPVLRELNQDTFKLLLFGTSETLSILSTFPQIKSSELNLTEPVTKDWPREKELPENDLNLILSEISDYHVCITGVASILQGQILKSLNSKKIMIWDNFKGNDTGDYWRTALQVQLLADIVIYPSQFTYEELPVKPKDYFIAGCPPVEEWELMIKNIDSDAVRQKLAITRKVILYIAGWSGDPECREGTELFALICREYLSKLLNDYEIIIQLHPRSDGDFERNEFGDLGRVNSRYICSLEEITSTASLVVCHKTTAGPKISAAGKKLIFVVPQSGYSNKLIEQNICPLVKNCEEFKNSFENDIIDLNKNDVYSAFQMPKNSKKNLALLLMNSLSSQNEVS